MSESRVHSAQNAAELVAIDALSWLAGDPETLGDFLALSGIGPADLRTAAASPGFLAGVLDHLLGNEKLLVAFAEDRGLKPATIAAARMALDEALS
jgi:hypothetical protein